MTLASQVTMVTDLARRILPGNSAVIQAADELDAALDPIGLSDNAAGQRFGRPGGFGSGPVYMPGTRAYEMTNDGEWSSCVYLGRADAGLWDRLVLWQTRDCQAWQDRLTLKITALANALDDAGMPLAGDAARAILDAAENQDNERENLTPTPKEWWDAVPGPAKALAVVAGIWLALDIAGKVRSV